jgi:hypothetical protein
MIQKVMADNRIEVQRMLPAPWIKRTRRRSPAVKESIESGAQVLPVVDRLASA